MPASSNIAQFQQGIVAIQRATKRSAVEIINRALRNVAFRAMQETTYAEPGKIQAELYRDKILLKLAVIRLRKRAGQQIIGRDGKAKLTKKGKGRFHKWNITRAQIDAEATRILKVRLARSKAMRAGWIPAVRAFGGRVRGDRLSGLMTSASRGGVQFATVSHLLGMIRNTLVTHDHTGKARGVGDIPEAQAGLERAIATVARENLEYAQKKISQTLKNTNR